MFSLKNKVIIITGGAGLLGKSFIEAILKFDGTPVVLDNSKKNIKKLQEIYIQKSYSKLQIYNCDITNEKQIKLILKKIIKKNKKIDALINNAANNHQPNSPKNNFFENLNLKDLEKDIKVGLIGAVLCSKIFGAQISKNKNGGSIINISSDLGLIAPNQNLYKNKQKISKKSVSYSVVKSGIIGLTRYLATYWPNKNLRSNCLCPGGIKNKQDKNFILKINKLIPLKRMAKKEDYMSTIVWMLSDETSYMNGAVISVDGGRTVW